MDKKIGVGFLIIFIFMTIFFVFIQSNNFRDDDDNVISNSNTTSNEIKIDKIGNVENVKLYETDYIYNDKINGYDYNEVILTDDQINKLKNEVSSIQLSDSSDAVIYGKYKLVLDNKIIFFDMGNDYGLYLNDNKVINFKDSIKQMIISNVSNCSCCTTSNCKINMCSCN